MVFSLTRQERSLMAFILFALLIGSTVKQCRSRHLEEHRSPAVRTPALLNR